MRNMGQTLDRWVVSWNIKQTLLMPQIYVKKMRSKRISDIVFFKHRYITQPTLTPVDIIVKALDDLTHAQKGRKNVEGDAQIKELERSTNCSTTS